MARPNDVGVGIAVFVVHPHGEKILLLKRKGAHAAGVWALPGGWIDKSDITLDSAAYREVLEETNLHLVNQVPLCNTTEEYADFRCVTLYYIGFVQDISSLKLMEPTKAEALEWVPWKDLIHGEPRELFPNLDAALQELQLWWHE